MWALYHGPGIHYHSVLDFNGQFPPRLCMGSLEAAAGGAVALHVLGELIQKQIHFKERQTERHVLRTLNYCVFLLSSKALSRVEIILKLHSKWRKFYNGESAVGCEWQRPSVFSCHPLNACWEKAPTIEWKNGWGEHTSDIKQNK